MRRDLVGPNDDLECRLEFTRYFFGGSRILRVETHDLKALDAFKRWTEIPLEVLPDNFLTWKMHTAWNTPNAIVTVFSKDGA